METKIWKPLKYNGISFEGKYEASDFGDIRSLDRYVNTPRGKRFQHGKIMEPYIAGGYYNLKIKVDGKEYCLLVHRAVLESFTQNPNPEIYTEVNHKDENKLNNRLSNLEWCTKSYNQRYSAYKRITKFPHLCPVCGQQTTNKLCCSKECIGKYYQKAKHPSRDELKDMIRTVPFLKIAERFGVSDKAICKWCENYDLPFKKKDIKSYSDEEWDSI